MPPAAQPAGLQTGDQLGERAETYLAEPAIAHFNHAIATGTNLFRRFVQASLAGESQVADGHHGWFLHEFSGSAVRCQAPSIARQVQSIAAIATKQKPIISGILQPSANEPPACSQIASQRTINHSAATLR